MSRGVVLVAEASRQVGLGHLAEMRVVAEALSRRGTPTVRLVLGSWDGGDDDVEWVGDYEALLPRMLASCPRVVCWNVRTHGWRERWDEIGMLPSRHLWIADIPNDDYPPVDVLVVPTLEPRWRPPQFQTRVYAGPEYFPLDGRGLRDLPAVRSRPRQVLLSLGGTDPTEASIRLIPALSQTQSTVVIGPAFRHHYELLRAAATAGVEAVVAPDGLRNLLLEHQLIISSGGDTLFEAAAAGTPALVTWGRPHEETQGRAFTAKGTARVLGRGADVDITMVAETVAALLASDELDAMSAAGPRTVDLGGADRIVDLLMELAAA